MRDPFVSVVTPVYNDDSYLEECIRSVLAQTCEDFEYIICDNHSTDRSGEIARDFAATDSRIRVVSPPSFVPQAKNFNYGLSQISERSRYCKLISSDDWLFPECLERMTQLAERNPTVGLVSSYRLIEAAPDCFGVPVERSVFPGREALLWQLRGTAFPFGTVSTVMYRAELVRRALPVFFPEDRFYFDVDVAFDILSSHDFGFVHQVLTFSRYQPGAIMDVASNMHVWPLMHFVLAAQYGRDLLPPDEYARHFARVRDDLYRNLGDAWLKDLLRREKKQALWDFQRGQLETVNHSVRPALLARGALSAVVRYLASPGLIVNGLRRVRATSS
jgi:glycosyltransferase involved in cell wall biosynthesis